MCCVMRLVQVLIPEGRRESIIDVLDDEGIDYVLFEETGRGDFEAQVSFPVPESGVETVMEKLYDAGIYEDSYTIILPTEIVISRRIEALKERYQGLRISREELIARAEDLAPATSTYMAFLILSVVIATTGLLLDSSATIIGAMVVAPLMGPAIASSVGAVIDDPDLTSRGVALQVGGLVIAIIVAAVLGFIIKESVLIPPGVDIREIPQIAERTSPNFLSLFLAIGSGIAGAISVMRQGGSALVGVAIAVALIPPAATAGLGIAWGYFGVFLTAGVLVLVNLLAINLSALLLFWFAGYRPFEAGAELRAKATVWRRAAIIIGALAVLSIVLALVTYASYETAQFQNQANATAANFLDQPEYATLDFVETNVEYKPADLVVGRDPFVNVLIGRQIGDQPPPDLADRLDARIEAVTGTEATVRVGFLEEQRSDQSTDQNQQDGRLDGRRQRVSMRAAT